MDRAPAGNTRVSDNLCLDRAGHKRMDRPVAAARTSSFGRSVFGGEAETADSMLGPQSRDIQIREIRRRWVRIAKLRKLQKTMKWIVVRAGWQLAILSLAASIDLMRSV